jgi:hypothetical protein
MHDDAHIEPRPNVAHKQSPNLSSDDTAVNSANHNS